VDCPLQVYKRSQLFIGTHDETLSVAMRVNNPALTPTGFNCRMEMMRSLYHLRFLHTFYVGSRQSINQFHEAGVVRITNGGLAIRLHPFGMLEPQVVVNLLPKLGIGVDFVRHGYMKDSRMPRECSASASVEWSTSVGAANTRQQQSDRARKSGTRLAALCATLG
jgi:hypothetical protein